LIGIIAGFFLKLINISDILTSISASFVKLFMILLLPPIIFESGYNMHKKPFFRNIGSVILYAFIGTFIAITFSSFLFYGCGQMGISYEFTMRQSWSFGSLISATDPVAVLAIFKAMDADENIYALVFGESIFNDAVGIVMYKTVEKIGIDQTKSSGTQVLEAAVDFLTIFFGSMVIGAMIALTVAFV